MIPRLRRGIVAGGLLAFARALGEFGAVVIVSGNILNKTLTAPVLISQLITGFKPEAAAAIGTILFGAGVRPGAGGRVAGLPPRGAPLMMARRALSTVSEQARRRLVHGGLTGGALIYVGVLVVAPLIGHRRGGPEAGALGLAPRPSGSTTSSMPTS